MLTFDLAALHTQDAQPGLPTPAWTKLTNALVVVFDTFRSGGEPLVTMKIMQASQLLFDVPLQRLINQGKPIVERLHREGVDVSSEAARLPISGMASNPALAIRYNVPEANKVRRIQLKFTKPDDFDVAYDHVRELGLWFTPTQKSRSAIHQVKRPGPSCPPSQLSEITGRPETAQSIISEDLPINGIRPSTASMFSPGSTASSRRPDSAASLSPERMSHLPLSARLDTTTASWANDLPPKRELPFERLDTPGSAGSYSTRSGSRPLSAMMGPPTLPASALNSNIRPNSRAGSNHGNDLPPLRQPTYISKTPTDSTRIGPSSVSNFAANDIARPRSAIVHNDYTALQQAMSSAPVLNPSPPRPASSYNTATTHPLSVVSSPRDRFDPSAELVTPPGSDANMLDSSPGETSGFQYDAGKLTAYSRQSDEHRVGLLNKFIFDHLEDDSFLALVTDMQMAWGRVGTGLE